MTKKWICLAIGAAWGWSVAAQLLPVPEITRVSVAPAGGDVTIEWKMPSSSVPIDGFIIFWLNPALAANFGIDTIHDTSVRSYTFHPDTKSHLSPTLPDPRVTTVPFTVAAFRNTPWTLSLRSAEHYNIQSVCRYDSCAAEIQLRWHPYKGWDNTSITYTVMQLSDGVPIPIAEVSAADTAYNIQGISENKEYVYYIEAKRQNGTMATGYKTEKFTRMPLPPSYITADVTQYNENSIAEITFSIDAAAQTFAYELLGSSRPDESFFASLGASNITEEHITLHDVQARHRAYYYRLAAWHICKNRYTAVSNIATALWLTVVQDGQTNTLQWDAFQKWETPAVHRLYRKTGDGAETVVATFADNGERMIFRDEVGNLPHTGMVCYWVEASPETASPAPQKAISNSICLQPESEIYIPDAFTPNGDGKNDKYYPSFSYPPEEYLFVAYDRIGTKVFETKNPQDGWDGRLQNGRAANEGVYGYYIRYKTAKGRVKEKRGTFILLLP
jgi:gliding motility-associated-like protein